MSLKIRLRALLEEKFPAVFAILLDAKSRLLPNRGEPELRLVPLLCHPDELALDVGANHGTYSGVMARHEVAAGAPGANAAFVFLCSGLGEDSSMTGSRCLELATE